jgi:excisionase family DNA binding protein
MDAPLTAPQPNSPRPEPFVSADEAARFLSVKRRYVLELARSGISGAYPLGTGRCRKVWVFRLSELAAAVMRKESSIHKTREVCDPAFGSPR